LVKWFGIPLKEIPKLEMRNRLFSGRCLCGIEADLVFASANLNATASQKRKITKGAAL
jgi:hypothetical protein